MCVYVLLLCFVITIACNFNCSKGKHECNVVGMYTINDLCCCVYVCLFVSVFVNSVCMQTSMCACMFVFVCVRVCNCLCVCVYMNVFIH